MSRSWRVVGSDYPVRRLGRNADWAGKNAVWASDANNMIDGCQDFSSINSWNPHQPCRDCST